MGTAQATEQVWRPGVKITVLLGQSTTTQCATCTHTALIEVQGVVQGRAEQGRAHLYQGRVALSYLKVYEP